jgi:hypothetical protein
MTDELHIEKEPAEVNIVTLSGDVLNGFVFVQPWHPTRLGREQPVDLLNSPEAFIPLETNDGVVLLSKHAIAEMDYAADQPSEGSPGTLPVGVSVSLTVTTSRGRSYAGTVAVEGPVNTPRLLDFMNRLAATNQSFLELNENARVRLINRNHIESIRTRD